MMKKTISFSLAILLFFSFFCFTPAKISAKESITLRVYNWGEYISDGSDDSLDVIEEFEKAYPNINVEYQTFNTNEEMFAKLSSGSANYDIIIPSDYMIGKMIDNNMLAELNFDNIPNYYKIDDEFKNLDFDKENKYSVPYTWGTVGIIYNTSKISESIDSWDALWDEKYTGQILMFDNPRDAYGIAEKKLGFSQNTTEKDELDACTELLKQQKQYIQAYVMDDIFAKMTNGDAAIAPYYAGDAITMIDDNEDLDFVVPKEGTNKFVDSMVVPKTSQNKEAAELFINFMLEDEIAKANIEFIGYSTPMTSVRNLLDDELKNSTIAYPSEDILNISDTFTTLPDDISVYMQDGWTDILAYGDDTIGDLILLCVIVLLLIGGIVYFYVKKKINERLY